MGSPQMTTEEDSQYIASQKKSLREMKALLGASARVQIAAWQEHSRLFTVAASLSFQIQ